MAALGASGGAKFITLVNQLGVSRDALARTLAALADDGYVMRNPGYGHPLRPEWILTPSGEALASAADALLRTARRAEADHVLDFKWGAPALVALDLGSARFGDLKRGLPSITPRALSQVLTDLESAGLVKRRVAPGPPATVSYALTPRGLRIAKRAADLARAAALA